jgi:hypothetical protein
LASGFTSAVSASGLSSAVVTGFSSVLMAGWGGGVAAGACLRRHLLDLAEGEPVERPLERLARLVGRGADQIVAALGLGRLLRFGQQPRERLVLLEIG